MIVLSVLGIIFNFFAAWVCFHVVRYLLGLAKLSLNKSGLLWSDRFLFVASLLCALSLVI